MGAAVLGTTAIAVIPDAVGSAMDLGVVFPPLLDRLLLLGRIGDAVAIVDAAAVVVVVNAAAVVVVVVAAAAAAAARRLSAVVWFPGWGGNLGFSRICRSARVSLEADADGAGAVGGAMTRPAARIHCPFLFTSFGGIWAGAGGGSRLPSSAAVVIVQRVLCRSILIKFLYWIKFVIGIGIESFKCLSINRVFNRPTSPLATNRSRYFNLSGKLN